jgi:hypothetical protein
MHSPHGLYSITVQCNNLRKSSCIPDDGLVWPKHFMNLHETLDYVVIPPIICEVALKNLLHTHTYQVLN